MYVFLSLSLRVLTGVEKWLSSTPSCLSLLQLSQRWIVTDEAARPSSSPSPQFLCSQCWLWRKSSPGIKTNEERKEKQTLWAEWRSCLVAFAQSGVTQSLERLHIYQAFYSSERPGGRVRSEVSRYKDVEKPSEICSSVFIHVIFQEGPVETEANSFNTATETFTPAGDYDPSPFHPQLLWMIRIVH